MEKSKEKTIKLSLSKAVILIIIGILIVIISVFIYLKIYKAKYNFDFKNFKNNYCKVSYDNKDYYILDGECTGEYDIQFIKYQNYKNLDYNDFMDKIKNINKCEILTYNEYKNYCKKFKLKRKYNYNCNYIVYSNTGTMNDAKLGGIEYYEDINKIKLYVWDDDIIHPGFFAISSAYILVIPIGNYEGSVRIQELYTYDEYKNIISPTDESTIFGPSVDKPIIYIYPEEETEVTVELGRKENLTCTYPLYEDKWEVTATPDGTLTDEETGRTYYALYWEGINSKKYSNKLEEGFVVKGEDTIKFLEEKLEILGLNEKEAEEFIVYWLPKMQNNKYNYIRFQTIEEINENMPLEVTPEPDTLIRVMMEWKGLNKYIKVEEQQLEKVERNGYTVVEWGGTEIK